MKFVGSEGLEVDDRNLICSICGELKGLQTALDMIGELIKSEYTDYDAHTRDPRWAIYARILAAREELVREHGRPA